MTAKKWMTHSAMGLTHKNGDRIFGFASGYAADLFAAGTPVISSLLRSSVTEAVGSVDIGDTLDVLFDGEEWWACSTTGRIGRLNWRVSALTEPDARTGTLLEIRNGTLTVQRVFVNEGRVVNIGGIVSAS